MEEAVRELARRLAGASSVSVLTGAGVSAASGIATFRGEDGTWSRFRPEDLATPEAFARDPSFVWGWYEDRRRQVAAARPNAAHEVLARWSRRFPHFRLLTQNVDELHERAGTGGVVRLHGSLWELQCWEACPQSPLRWRDETVPLTELPPSCPWCRGLVRPGVVWFGEALPEEALLAAAEAVQTEVFLAIGTSGVVQPAAGLLAEARARGAWTAEINPEPGALAAAADLSVPAAAEDALPEVEARLAAEGAGGC